MRKVHSLRFVTTPQGMAYFNSGTGLVKSGEAYDVTYDDQTGMVFFTLRRRDEENPVLGVHASRMEWIRFAGEEKAKAKP